MSETSASYSVQRRTCDSFGAGFVVQLRVVSVVSSGLWPVELLELG